MLIIFLNWSSILKLVLKSFLRMLHVCRCWVQQDSHTQTHSASEQNRSTNCSDLIFNRSVKLTLLSIIADNIIYCQGPMSILWWNTVGIVPSWYHRCYSCSVNQWRLFLVFILDERRSYWHKKNVKAGLNCYLKRTTYFTGNSTCIGEGGGLKMKYLTFDNTLSWTIWFILICSTYFKYYTGRYTFYETIVPPVIFASSFYVTNFMFVVYTLLFYLLL